MMLVACSSENTEKSPDAGIKYIPMKELEFSPERMCAVKPCVIYQLMV
jgi:hypothetical protein